MDEEVNKLICELIRLQLVMATALADMEEVAVKLQIQMRKQHAKND